MLQAVDLGDHSIQRYVRVVGPDEIAELRELAAPLRGLRLMHVGSTPYGGGVSELLRSVVPLERDLGLAADWRVISGDEPFFKVTKTIHNGLQGEQRGLTPEQMEVYRDRSMSNAQLLGTEFDVIIVHDPHPLAMRHFLGTSGARWIWRCHIDTSEPHLPVWQFLEPYLADYDAAVFTLPQFVPPGFPVKRVEIIPPAIDPLSPKNMPLPQSLRHRILSWIGIDVGQPLVTQVSRFDPWKDPLGVISAYRLARQHMPELQLALVGSMALDDPEGWDIYRQIMAAAESDPLIHVFTNMTGVGNIEVNTFQRQSRVVIQKSIREGFGLVVSEALWKGTPVVAGRAGGIPMQMPEGTEEYLVDSIEDTAERVLHLLTHQNEAKRVGAAGREHVHRHCLLPRLLADELRLVASLV
ncbi:MAG: glycosyltransferase [Chloroflexi bacterium]|nr:glycosyltransferase [Chloroflexota bacterium]